MCSFILLLICVAVNMSCCLSEEFSRVGNTCYKFVDKKLHFNSASRYCQGCYDNGSLAEPNSASAAVVIAELLTNHSCKLNINVS